MQVNGVVYNSAMGLVGVVAFNGRVLNQGIFVVGGVDTLGHIYTARNQVLGQVHPNHIVYAYGSAQQAYVYVGYVGHGVEDVRFIGGAVLLLLLLAAPNTGRPRG